MSVSVDVLDVYMASIKEGRRRDSFPVLAHDRLEAVALASVLARKNGFRYAVPQVQLARPASKKMQWETA
jgi:hypothetical protein